MIVHENQVGETLRCVRESLSLTQGRVAIAARLQQSQLSQIEGGTTVPTIKTFIRIVEGMGLCVKIEKK